MICVLAIPEHLDAGVIQLSYLSLSNLLVVSCTFMFSTVLPAIANFES